MNINFDAVPKDICFGKQMKKCSFYEWWRMLTVSVLFFGWIFLRLSLFLVWKKVVFENFTGYTDKSGQKQHLFTSLVQECQLSTPATRLSDKLRYKYSTCSPPWCRSASSPLLAPDSPISSGINTAPVHLSGAGVTALHSWHQTLR